MTEHTDPSSNETLAMPELVDWNRVGRRMRASAIVLSILAVLSWLVLGIGSDQGLVLRELPGFLGLGMIGMVVMEFIFVGGSALQGMLRAGEAGHRLAGGDVGIFPPQLTGRSPRKMAERTNLERQKDSDSSGQAE